VLPVTQNAVGALFDEDDRVGTVIAKLVATGVRSDSIFLTAASGDRLRRLTARNHARPLVVTGEDDAALASALANHGLDPDRAAHFAAALGEGVLLVLPGADVTPKRVGILVEARADLGLANMGGVEHTIPLRAEQVTIGKTVVVTNEVTVRTDVITEVQSYDVELKREEFVIERTAHGPHGRSVETVRIPLRHEEAAVTKRTIVTEEVSVRTEAFVDVAHVEETVRHEVLSVAEMRTPDG
jgi:uncharacterized protein (TIGR02271 family)